MYFSLYVSILCSCKSWILPTPETFRFKECPSTCDFPNTCDIGWHTWRALDARSGVVLHRFAIDLVPSRAGTQPRAMEQWTITPWQPSETRTIRSFQSHDAPSLPPLLSLAPASQIWALQRWQKWSCVVLNIAFASKSSQNLRILQNTRILA